METLTKIMTAICREKLHELGLHANWDRLAVWGHAGLCCSI